MGWLGRHLMGRHCFRAGIRPKSTLSSSSLHNLSPHCLFPSSLTSLPPFLPSSLSLSSSLSPSFPLYPPSLQGQSEVTGVTESNLWSHLDLVRAGRVVGMLGLQGRGWCPEGRTSTTGDERGGRKGKEQHLEAKNT